MAYIGPWGQFIHIPKCAGLSMRSYLEKTYRTGGHEEKGMHDLPSVIKNAFTIVRHPADWLLSFYTYYFENSWRWEDLPAYIDDQFSFANGMFFPQYVEAVTSTNPGAVGNVYDHYCQPGVKVYRLEELDERFEGMVNIHSTGHKPAMTPKLYDMIYIAERDTLERYGYAD